MLSRSIGVQALALVLCTALCGCSIVGLGYRAAPKHKTGHQEAERLSQLAQMYERQGHPAGAMRLYRQALQVNPRSQQARERLMALSSQHDASPQSPAGAAPSPAHVDGTMLARKDPASTGARPIDPAPSQTASVDDTPSPALAPEPPTTPIRAVASRSTVAAARPSTTSPAADANSVVAESASAVASAAAPFLALMSPPTGNVSLRTERQPTQVAAATQPAAVPQTIPGPPADVDTPSLPELDPVPAPVVQRPSLPAGLKPLAVAPPPEAHEPSTLHDDPPAPLGEPERLAPPVASELPATVAIVTLPPLPPRIEPQATAPRADWTSTRSATPDIATARVSASAPAPRPALQPAARPAPTNSGIAIRPQQTPEEVVGRATLHSSEWTSTDLVRLCPDASAELLTLVRQLESPDAVVRKDGLIELADLGDEARPALGAVRALFHDSDSPVRAHAAWTACRVSGVTDECVSVLAEVTRSDDPAGATFAAYCLGQLESDAAVAVPALQSACRSPNTAIRLCAAEALLKITPDAAEPLSTLIDGLRDPEPEYRWLAALSLSAASSVYQESAVLALIPVLHDPVSDVCSSAALALGAYGAAAGSAAPELQATLSHPDSEVREAAAVALECITH